MLIDVLRGLTILFMLRDLNLHTERRKDDYYIRVMIHDLFKVIFFDRRPVLGRSSK